MKKSIPTLLFSLTVCMACEKDTPLDTSTYSPKQKEKATGSGQGQTRPNTTQGNSSSSTNQGQASQVNSASDTEQNTPSETVTTTHSTSTSIEVNPPAVPPYSLSRATQFAKIITAQKLKKHLYTLASDDYKG